MKGHLFNPGPRFGFAFDPKGDGKTAIRGGSGIFFEYGNGNEANAESLEGTPPRVLTASQPNITGYTSIGGGGSAPTLFPFTVNNEPPAIIETRALWPYVQQWHLDVQRELPAHFVGTVSYVGSKGTHLTDTCDLNQLHSLPLAQNPYGPGQTLTASDCANGTANGVTPAPGSPLAATFSTACGNNPNPFRPFLGFGTLELLETEANSHYQALQGSLRRSLTAIRLTILQIA
jgi:hypothetical protein